MKYVALLRGVNVGGNAVIKMADLKEAVEKCGFTNVRTYIQSGNITFESPQKTAAEIEATLEDTCFKNFKLDIRVIVRTFEQLKKVLSEVPVEWITRKGLRCYLAFIKGPATAQDVACEVELKEGIDSMKVGEGVLYMSTLLSGLTKSKFTKLIAKPVYKDITIRNYNTAQKLLALMQA